LEDKFGTTEEGIEYARQQGWLSKGLFGWGLSKASQVKAYLRKRKGKLERVKSHARKRQAKEFVSGVRREVKELREELEEKTPLLRVKYEELATPPRTEEERKEKLRRKKVDPETEAALKRLFAIKSMAMDVMKRKMGYSDEKAELMFDLLTKAIQIKGFFRTRKGKREWVKSYHREMGEIKDRIVEVDSRIVKEKGVIQWIKPITLLGEVEWMSPDEYIRRIHISKKMTSKELKEYRKRAIKHGAKGILEYPPYSPESMKHWKAQVDQGKQIDMPWIEYDDRGLVSSQEGYHRILLAKEMGLKQVPVVIIEKPLVKARMKYILDLRKSRKELVKVRKSQVEGKFIPYKYGGKVIWAKVYEGGLIVKSDKVVYGTKVLVKSKIGSVTGIGKHGVTVRTDDDRKHQILYKDLNLWIEGGK